MNKFRFI